MHAVNENTTEYRIKYQKAYFKRFQAAVTINACKYRYGTSVNHPVKPDDCFQSLSASALENTYYLVITSDIEENSESDDRNTKRNRFLADVEGIPCIEGSRPEPGGMSIFI